MTRKGFRGVAVAALTVAGAFAAQAADLPTRKEAPAPVFVPPPFTWTGFYIGANTGGIWTSGSRNLHAFSGLTDSWLIADFPGGIGNGQSGWLLGGQAGYNYQWGMWVFGVETDFDWSSLHKNFNFVSAPFEGVGIPRIFLGDTISANGHFNL